ncbi:hypothetical protein HPB52_020863 [Rhipicephalus sanguineus]|uniref:Uncharacterized protein n=1 Tax=Rhipicephalus sanguineus TaxID=34632 RepID=A0A9D4QEC4_RHISA|nr:hypothetical protein HPB52_020863 [Rhipicephalus sanguineus]
MCLDRFDFVVKQLKQMLHMNGFCTRMCALKCELRPTYGQYGQEYLHLLWRNCLLASFVTASGSVGGAKSAHTLPSFTSVTESSEYSHLIWISK